MSTQEISMASASNKTWGCCDNEGGEEHVHSVDCIKCKKLYHIACMSAYGFDQDSDIPSEWNCPACVSGVPKIIRKDSTPLRNVTISRGNKRPALSSPPKPAATATTEDIRSIVQELLKQELTSALKEINTMMLKIVSNQLEPIKQDIRDVQNSMNFMSSRFDEMEGELSDTKKRMSEIQAENTSLKSTVSDLSRRFDLLEQQSRSNNLEIQCVPENKNENLCTIVSNLIQAVGCDLNESNIMHCTRIAKMNTDTTRPRSIVVQLASPRARDHLLAAVISFNKANPKDKLNCAHLGFANVGSPVFVVEHLSPANKKLHAATRHAAKGKGYKHIWVKFGKVFVRKTDGSDIIYIKNLDCLKRLV